MIPGLSALAAWPLVVQWWKQVMLGGIKLDADVLKNPVAALAQCKAALSGP